jgi:hypothetical protein
MTVFVVYFKGQMKHFTKSPSRSIYESLLLQENVQKVTIIIILQRYSFSLVITKGTIMQEKYQKQESMCPSPTKMQTSNHFKS